MRVYYYAPDTVPTTCVFTFLPFASTQRNTEPRLRETARRSGRAIIAMHAPGTALDRSLHMRRLLHIKNLAAVADYVHDDVARHSRMCGSFERVIGWGDSGRASLIATLGQRGLFDAVLTRDGALLQEMSVWRGAHLLLRHGGDRRANFGDEPADTRPFRRLAAMYAVTCGLAEMDMYRNLMCSNIPMGALLDLAKNLSVPYFNVGLTHGLAGHEDAAKAFNIALDTARHNVHEASPQGAIRAPFCSSVEPWGHGDLLSPAGASKHLSMAEALISGVGPKPASTQSAPSPTPY